MFWDGQLPKPLRVILGHLWSWNWEETLSLLVAALWRDTWGRWQPCSWLCGQGQCTGMENQADEQTGREGILVAPASLIKMSSGPDTCLLFWKAGCSTYASWHDLPSLFQVGSCAETERHLRWGDTVTYLARISTSSSLPGLVCQAGLCINPSLPLLIYWCILSTISVCWWNNHHSPYWRVSGRVSILYLLLLFIILNYNSKR